MGRWATRLFAIVALLIAATTAYGSELSDIHNAADRAVASFTSQWSGHVIAVKDFLLTAQKNSKTIERLFATYAEFRGKCPYKFQTSNDSLAESKANTILKTISNVIQAESATNKQASKTFSDLVTQTKETRDQRAKQMSYDSGVSALRYLEGSHVRLSSLLAVYPMISDYAATMTLLSHDNCLMRAMLSVKHTEINAIEEMQQTLANYTDVQSQYINKNSSLMNELIDITVSAYDTGFYP